MIRLLVIASLALVAPSAMAIDTSQLEDPAMQARYEKIVDELRCLVCQNQTIADSDAALAVDLRRQVRQMLLDGDSDDEIREYMVTRYGDFVLYRPPLAPRTFAIWFGPLLLLIIGAIVVARVVSQHRLGDGTDD